MFPGKHGPQASHAHGGLTMRKLIATVFNYSLDGLLADEGTAYWDFCFSLPENRQPDIRRNSTFSEPRPPMSWAAPPTRASPGR